MRDMWELLKKSLEGLDKWGNRKNAWTPEPFWGFRGFRELQENHGSIIDGFWRSSLKSSFFLEGYISSTRLILRDEEFSSRLEGTTLQI